MNQSAPLKLQSFLGNVLALGFLALLYYILRIPTGKIPLAFYDEGEMLYHAFSVLQGRVPYRDDYTHHFLGYILPFVLGAKLVGFSAELIRQVAFVGQLASAFGVFILLKQFAPYRIAFLGAALAVSAREPWVQAYFVHYELNFCLIGMWICLFFAQQKKFVPWFIFACALCGLAGVIDQRGLVLGLIPASMLLFCRKERSDVRVKALMAGAVAFCSALLACLLYLYAHAALTPFIEQTFIFPATYRSGSQSLFNLLFSGLQALSYLPSETPFLVAFGVVGLLLLLFNPRRYPQELRRIVLASLLPLFVICFLSGRNFSYYSIPFLPLLAILSVLPFINLPKASSVRQTLSVVALSTPILFALLSTAVFSAELRKSHYQGDGVSDVVAYLREHLNEKDSLYVWGHRMDIYVHLKRLSHFPLSSVLFIYPDIETNKPEELRSHIYPKYEEEFIQGVKTNPPTYFVVFRREGAYLPETDGSRVLFETLRNSYKRVFESKKKDLLGAECWFEVFNKNP